MRHRVAIDICGTLVDLVAQSVGKSFTVSNSTESAESVEEFTDNKGGSGHEQ